MAVTLKQVEDVGAYPATPEGLSERAQSLDPNMIWQRIEAYTAHRYTARPVSWIIEGPGEWVPPLAPATVTAVEMFCAGAWEPVTLDETALGGFYVPADASFRVQADVGGGDVPPAVQEAFRRLAEYSADEPDRAGASSYSVNMGAAIEESYQRNPAYMARALQQSGAADLLRQYRRV